MKSIFAVLRTVLLYVILTIPFSFLISFFYTWVFRIFLVLPISLVNSKLFLYIYSLFSGYVLTTISLIASIYINRIKSYKEILSVLIISLLISLFCIFSLFYFRSIDFILSNHTMLLFASIGMMICSIFMIVMLVNGSIFNESDGIY